MISFKTNIENNTVGYDKKVSTGIVSLSTEDNYIILDIKSEMTSLKIKSSDSTELDILIDYLLKYRQSLLKSLPKYPLHYR